MRTKRDPLFDAVVMVDWSAAAAPARGADSIWWALHRPGSALPERLENPRTRAAAMDALTRLAEAEITAGRRLLLGFDFPFGYPVGAAARMTGEPSWSAMWALLAEAIVDGADNANNRFDVAARLNRTAYDGEGPFWGRPPRREPPGLPAKKPAGYGARYPAERRAVERRVRSTHPVWKLFTTGSVGGQALVGIAVLERLRRRLGTAAAVWPFETAFAERLDAPVVIAEIYPSLMPPDPREAVKDAGQVRAVASRLAALAEAGRLNAVLAAPPDLTPGDAEAALREEGWILGVGAEAVLLGRGEP